MSNIPDDFMQMLEESHKNTSRNYGDVRVTQFDCGCILVASVTKPLVTEIKKMCEKHAEAVGKL